MVPDNITNNFIICNSLNLLLLRIINFTTGHYNNINSKKEDGLTIKNMKNLQFLYIVSEFKKRRINKLILKNVQNY